MADDIFKWIDNATDEQIDKTFRYWRWGELGPYCIDCESRRIGRIARGSRWRCKDCRIEFSDTTWTPFHNTKLSRRQMLKCIALVSKAFNESDVIRLVGVHPRSAPGIVLMIREIDEWKEMFYWD